MIVYIHNEKNGNQTEKEIYYPGYNPFFIIMFILYIITIIKMKMFIFKT